MKKLFILLFILSTITAFGQTTPEYNRNSGQSIGDVWTWNGARGVWKRNLAGPLSLAWGTIIGTLSSQTDLQTALSAKLSLTGGTLTGNLSVTGSTGDYVNRTKSLIHNTGTGANMYATVDIKGEDFSRLDYFDLGSANARASVYWDAATATLNIDHNLDGIDAKFTNSAITFYDPLTVEANIATGNGFGQMYSQRYDGSVVLDWNKSNVRSSTLTNGTNVVTLSNGKDGGEYWFIVKQPASGAAGTLVWTGSPVFRGGSAPVLHRVNGYVDILHLMYNGLDSKWYVEGIWDSLSVFGGGGGGINTATNLGTTHYQPFKDTASGVIRLRTLYENNANMSFTPGADSTLFDFSATPSFTDVTATNNLAVGDSAVITGNTSVSGNTHLGGLGTGYRLRVDGQSYFNGNHTVEGLTVLGYGATGGPLRILTPAGSVGARAVFDSSVAVNNSTWALYPPQDSGRAGISLYPRPYDSVIAATYPVGMSIQVHGKKNAADPTHNHASIYVYDGTAVSNHAVDWYWGSSWDNQMKVNSSINLADSIIIGNGSYVDTPPKHRLTITDGGTDYYGISVTSDQLTIYNDAGTPAALFDIDSSGRADITSFQTATSGNLSGLFNTTSHTPTGASTANLYTTVSEGRISGSQNTATAYALYGYNRYSSTATLASVLSGVTGNGFFSGSGSNFGTVTNSYGGLFKSVYHFSGSQTGTVTNATGVFVDSSTTASITLTNANGIVIQEQNKIASKKTNLLIGTGTTPTGKYSIYNSSPDPNYFAGPLVDDTLYGSESASGNLTIASTSDATKGKILFGGAGASVYDEVNDYWGIGEGAPTVPLHLTPTSTATSGNLRTLHSNPTITPSGTSTAANFGMYSDLAITGSNNTAKSYGIQAQVRYSSSGSATALYGGYFSGFYGSTSTKFTTVTDAIGVYSRGVNHFTNNDTGTITNVTNFYADGQSRGSTNLAFTNVRGMVIANQTQGGTSNVNLLIGTATSPAGNFSIYNSSTYMNYLGGNLGIGATAAGTSGTNVLVLGQGVEPTTSPADAVQLFADTVGAGTTSELKVRDEAGNITTLSPHNFSGIPEGPSEEMAWAFYSERDGKYVNVDMLKLARLIEKLTGEKLVYIGKK